MIEQLPPLTPDAARAGRVAARCRARLARHRPAYARPGFFGELRRGLAAAAFGRGGGHRGLRHLRPPGPRALAIERAIGVGFCLIYFSAIVLTALEMAGAR